MWNTVPPKQSEEWGWETYLTTRRISHPLWIAHLCYTGSDQETMAAQLLQRFTVPLKVKSCVINPGNCFILSRTLSPSSSMASVLTSRVSDWEYSQLCWGIPGIGPEAFYVQSRSLSLSHFASLWFCNLYLTTLGEGNYSLLRSRRTALSEFSWSFKSISKTETWKAHLRTQNAWPVSFILPSTRLSQIQQWKVLSCLSAVPSQQPQKGDTHVAILLL